MSRKPLFEDLLNLPVEEVQATYEGLLNTIKTHEEERKKLFINKRIHSEAIKFAVNKTPNPPSLEGNDVSDVVRVAVEEKMEFDVLIAQRDDFVQRLVIPKHRVELNLSQFFERLTQDKHYSEAPSLASELEMFSRFFELQAMFDEYKEHATTLAELRTVRTSLLEHVKTINREDRKLAQELANNSENSRKMRREAGRLRSFLESHANIPTQQLPAPTEELSQRLASGQALSMDEFAAMLEHGGLTDIKSTGEESNPPKRKKAKQRKAAPRRGNIGHGSSDRA